MTIELSAVGQRVLDDQPTWMRLTFTAFGGQIHLGCLACDRMPVEVRCEPLPRRDRAPLGGVGVVENHSDRRRQRPYVAGRDGHSGLAVDHRFTESADV